MKKKALAFKLVSGGIVAVLIPLLVVGIFASFTASRALETAAKNRAVAGASKLADMVQAVLASEMKVAGEMALSSEAVNAAAGGNTDVMNRKLAVAMNKIGKDYETILVADAKGMVVADSNNGSYKGISIAERDYFAKAKQGNAGIGSVVISKASGNPVVTICAPVMKDGGFAGIVAATMKIDYFIQKITAKVGETGYGFMIDQTGMCIVHPVKENILKLDLTKVAGMEDITKKMIAKESGVEDYVYNKTSKIAGFAPVGLTGWSVGVTQNTDEFLAASHSIRNFIILAVFIFLAITIVGIIIFSRSISRPIMDAVTQMNEAAGQVASASSQVAAASQSLAEGSAEQASALEETSSSLEEMSSMTKQNAENAVEADGLMKGVYQVVVKAGEAMSNLTNSMKEITSASEETSKIIKTIDEIAFQTNLLALNAAVEAARAGEAGAGFAVVAEEVRNLAVRSADAAKNTANLIESTVKKIKDGSALVDKTNETFAEVTASGVKVGDLVGEISAASQEQFQGVDQINKAVSEMDKVTQQTAANAEESAAAAEEMNAQAEQMKEIAMTLHQIISGDAAGAGNARRYADASVRESVPSVLAKKVKKMEPGRFITIGEAQAKTAAGQF